MQTVQGLMIILATYFDGRKDLKLAFMCLFVVKYKLTENLTWSAHLSSWYVYCMILKCSGVSLRHFKQVKKTYCMMVVKRFQLLKKK